MQSLFKDAHDNPRSSQRQSSPVSSPAQFCGGGEEKEWKWARGVKWMCWIRQCVWFSLRLHLSMLVSPVTMFTGFFDSQSTEHSARRHLQWSPNRASCPHASLPKTEVPWPPHPSPHKWAVLVVDFNRGLETSLTYRSLAVTLQLGVWTRGWILPIAVSLQIRIFVYFPERTEILPICLAEERKKERKRDTVFLFARCFLCTHLTMITILIIIGGLTHIYTHTYTHPHDQNQTAKPPGDTGAGRCVPRKKTKNKNGQWIQPWVLLFIKSRIFSTS